jgi:hypothetical protein
MRIGSFAQSACVGVLLFMPPAPAGAQIVETVGSRAQGMGGAFVAVANDSSATWWNPAGLADGPFLDMAIAQSVTEVSDTIPARRDGASWFAFGTPPFGFSYYRTRTTEVRPFDPTGGAEGGRQDRRAGVPVRSLAASHIGVTVLQTLFPGVHAGTTLRYVRGTLRNGIEDGLRPADDLLDAGADYEGGAADHEFDLDIGVLAVAGPFRIGGVGRNLREPDFGGGTFTLPRQVRAGVAFDAAKLPGTPLTVAVDFDVISYETATGDRRVVAVGAEQWLLARRLAIRGGARFNTAGAEERAVTGGASVSLRAGLYLDGYGVLGGATDERGWGLGVRVSF